MAFKKLNFTKTWCSPSDFPTEQDNETQVRADLQLLHDECRDGLNRLMEELEAASAAASLGAADEHGAATVQSILSRLTGLLSGVSRLDRTLGEDHGGVPTSLAVRDALDGVVVGDLSGTGGAYILQHLWLATPHSPKKAKAENGEPEETAVFSESGEYQRESCTVYRAKTVTARIDGTLQPENAERITVAADGDTSLGGWYWSRSESFGEVFYTEEGGATRCYLQEFEEMEPMFYILIPARPVTAVVIPEKNGDDMVLYGPEGAYPADGFAADPAAAPFDGYLYRGMGPFRNLPLFLGEGEVSGTGAAGATYIPAVSEDGVLSWTNNRGLPNPAPVQVTGPAYKLTEADKAEIVAAALAALPKAEEASF